MTRILVDDEWYDQIAVDSLYEREFEEIIVSRAETLFPGYHTVTFRRLVWADGESARADLALVGRDYRDWWVVEVELGSHSLSHVVPQVRTLSRARYGADDAKYLRGQHPELVEESLLTMMKGTQPRVLVTVNMPRPTWVSELAPYDALVCVVEIYRSDRNHHIYRVSGDQPATGRGLISECFLDPALPRLLILTSPAGLGIARNERLRIWYEGQVSEWSRLESQDRVWLNPVSSNPLRLRKQYRLVRHEDGSFHILDS